MTAPEAIKATPHTEQYTAPAAGLYLVDAQQEGCGTEEDWAGGPLDPAGIETLVRAWDGEDLRWSRQYDGHWALVAELPVPARDSDGGDLARATVFFHLRPFAA